MKNEWILKTTDGLELCAWSSTVENEKAGLVIVHGQGEHSGRYEHITKAMNLANISVFSYDQRGHGRSNGQRGHIPNYDQLLGDLAQFVADVRVRIGQKPLFVYGHSMGGNVALNFAVKHANKISAVAASSPWVKLAFEPPAYKVVLAKVIDKIAPALSMASGLEIAALSRDTEVCEKYKNDPLNHDQITARMYNHVYQAGLDLLEAAPYFSVPAYVYHGSADRLTSPVASAEFAERSNGKVEFRLWDGFYHETHNEPGADMVIKTLVDWFVSKI